MLKKWIGPLVLGIMLVVPTGFLNAVLDEGGFVPCYSNVSSAVGDTVYHTIQAGDTLWDISTKNHVDLDQLKELNNLDEKSVLTVGDKIKIPNGDNPVHIIKNGETLWNVAQNYGLSLEQLYALNPGVNADDLKVGDSVVLTKDSTIRAGISPQPSRGRVVRTVFSWPVIGKITSAYGWRDSGFHHGLDISAHLGDPVRSAAAGWVSFTGVKGVYGKMVVINHLDGRQTAYAHLSRIGVSMGSQVNKGDFIGNIGVTGNSTGPHLHFEIRQDNKTINPVSMLR